MLCCLGGESCQGAEYAPGFEMLVIGQEVKQGEACVSWQQLDAADDARTVQYTGLDGVEEIVQVSLPDGQVLPGARPVTESMAYVAHDGVPVTSSIYTTLVVHPTCAIKWQAFDGNVYPENAVKGGRRLDKTLYVARTTEGTGQAVYAAGYLNKNRLYINHGMIYKSTSINIEILIAV